MCSVSQGIYISTSDLAVGKNPGPQSKPPRTFARIRTLVNEDGFLLACQKHQNLIDTPLSRPQLISVARRSYEIINSSTV